MACAFDFLVCDGPTRLQMVNPAEPVAFLVNCVLKGPSRAIVEAATVVVNNNRIEYSDSQRKVFFSGAWDVNVKAINCDTHSHPDAAAERMCATKSMDKFSKLSKQNRFDVSTSSRESCSGDRPYYGVKDLMRPGFVSSYRNSDLLTLVDVDYYLDDHDWKRYLRGNNMLIYTFRPKTLAGRTPNGMFYFVNNRVVREVVSGGEVYESGLWCHDKPTLTNYSFPYLYVYNVDRMESVSMNREFVLLTCRCRVLDPLAIWYRHFSAGDFKLDRSLVEQIGDVLSMLTMDKKGKLTRSFLRIGTAVSVEVDESAYLAMSVLCASSKWSNVSDVEKFLSRDLKDRRPNVTIEAALLYDCLTSRFRFSSISTRSGVRSFQVDPMLAIVPGNPPPPLTEFGETSAIQLLPPVVSESAVTPVESVVNDTACIQERVVRVTNDVVPPQHYFGWAKEFVEICVPPSRVGVGVPLSHDLVWEKQDRAPQRMRAERTRCWQNKRLTVQAFQKKEYYGKVGAPRNISTVTPTHTHDLSAFTMSFKQDVLVHHHWYMPCLTPPQTVDAVRSFVRNLDEVLDTDFSSFDGTFSRFVRCEVEQACYARWARDDFKDSVLFLLGSELNCRARTKRGVRYSPGHGRLSGSPLTTDGNCIGNAFIAFCGNRLAGFNPLESFFRLGPKYGDDSHEDPLCLVEQASKELGFSLKVNRVRRGQPLPFLGRVFINPWVSDLTIQDPIRTLRHIHLGFKDDSKTLADARCNRVAGYLVTDGRTPVISEYCRMVQRVEGRVVMHTPGVNKEIDMRVAGGPWPQPVELVDDMYRYVATNLNMSVGEMLWLCSVLDDISYYGDVPEAIHNVVSVNYRCVINGETWEPDVKDGEVVEVIPPPPPPVKRVNLTRKEVNSWQPIALSHWSLEDALAAEKQVTIDRWTSARELLAADKADCCLPKSLPRSRLEGGPRS